MKKIFVFLTALCMFNLLISATCFSPLENVETFDLLYIVDAKEDQQIIQDSSLSAPYLNIVKFITPDQFDLSRFDKDVLAVPVSCADQIPLEQLFKNGVCIYLYGTLTIEDYKEYVGINTFSIKKSVYSQDDIFLKTIYQEFASSTDYHVIALNLTRDKGLLCEINSSPIMPYEYFSAILNNYSAPNPYAHSAIDSDFDFVSIYDKSNASTHLDYVLYQDIGENDKNSDYYALKTNVWADCAVGVINEVDVRHSLPNSGDNFFSHGPASQSTSAFSIQLSIPSGSISVSTSFSQKVSIAVSSNYTTDVVEWNMTKSHPYIGSGNIANEILTSATSWATQRQGDSPMITVGYRSVRGTASGSQHRVVQDWVSLNIGFAEL